MYSETWQIVFSPPAVIEPLARCHKDDTRRREANEIVSLIRNNGLLEIEEEKSNKLRERPFVAAEEPTMMKLT